MNLFLLGWNLNDEFARTALDALRGLNEKYPQLDPDTLWSRRYGTAFAASMHTSGRAAAPRDYVFCGDSQATLWDGVCVTRKGSFKAHRAEELAQHWESLPETLEGQFVAARIAEDPPSIELITDPLGMLHTYFAKVGGAWIVSNSVQLLERLAGARTWDPLGVSTFIGLGWTAGDRTLQQEVMVIPGGQHWIWDARTPGLRQQTYYSVSNLPQLPQPQAQELVQELAASLIELCRQLFSSYGPLTAMLTGGQDSRVIAALLTAGKIQSTFTTGAYLKEGQPWDEDTARDVEIACQVARILGSPHQVNAREAEELTNWDAAAKRWVRQYDGLRSLCDLIDITAEAQTIQRLPIYIGGAGGEVARGFYTVPEMLDKRIDKSRIAHLLLQRCFRGPRTLFQRTTIELLEQYFLTFVTEMVESGLPVCDVPDAFYACERVRRFIGSAQQINRATMDRFHPLCARPWLEAAFALPVKQRCAGILHQQLIGILAPQLQSVPFDKPPKGTTDTYSNSVAGRTAGVRLEGIDRRAALLKANLGRIREVCFDQASSPLWEFIDRDTFEQTSAPEMCEQSGWPYWRTSEIYDIATLFYYSIV